MLAKHLGLHMSGGNTANTAKVAQVHVDTTVNLSASPVEGERAAPSVPAQSALAQEVERTLSADELKARLAIVFQELETTHP